MDRHEELWQHWRWPAVAGLAFVIGATASAELLMLPSAIAFGFLVRRPVALLLAFAPFLLALPDASGEGDPPDWVAGLVFETPMLALFIGAGVLLGMVSARLRRTA